MEIPQSYINKDVRALYDAAREKQAQRAAITQQQLAQQQAAFDEQRATRLAELDQEVKDLPQEALNFPALVHDIEREKAINEANYIRNSANLRTFGMQPGAAEREIKSVDSLIKDRFGNALKDFEETENYKTARENWNEIRKSNKKLGSISQSLETVRNMLSEGKDAQATDYLRSIIVKDINSLESSDAVATGEILFKYADLMTAPEIAEQKGKSAFNPSAYYNKLRQAKTRDEQEGIKRTLGEEIDNLFRANPKQFTKMAITGVNDKITGYNNALRDQVINTTSPGVAKKMGAIPIANIPLFEDDIKEQRISPLATPNPLSSGSPINAPIPSVSGGARNATSPTMEQPTGNPLQAPLRGSTIFRIVQ